MGSSMLGERPGFINPENSGSSPDYPRVLVTERGEK